MGVGVPRIRVQLASWSPDWLSKDDVAIKDRQRGKRDFLGEDVGQLNFVGEVDPTVSRGHRNGW